MKKNIITASLIILSLCACSKEQKVIFEAKSISYKRGDSFMVSDIKKDCENLSDELSAYLKDGWRVVTSSPKEIQVTNDMGSCVGTEYVVEK